MWRVYKGLPVIEIVNNWVCGSFADSYRPPLIADRIAQVLEAVQPDVLHIHNLLNLSFDLPAMARARGIPVVATLHDYTLVCAAGGQRIHQGDEHVCHTIDTERCVRCFRESPFFSQMSFGRLAGGRLPLTLNRAAVAMAQRLPRLAARVSAAAARSPLIPITRQDIDARLSAARKVFEAVDLFVAPSPSIAAEFRQLGVHPAKIHISDYGFVPLSRRGDRTPGAPRRTESPGPLRIAFVGTLVWHKGAHVLLNAVRTLPTAAYELKIFGNPDVFPDYSARLRAQAAGLPVRFMGAFDREQTANVYAQIDVLVVPSLWLENSPLVIHEAFMAGIPVVGARTGGIADLIDEGRTGLLYDPRSPADLGVQLRRLTERPDLLAALMEGARTAPHIKSMADDAREWDAAYRDVRRRRATVGDTA